MSKAELWLGVKYSEMNKQQKKIYQNMAKKESRKKHPESIKESNAKYREKQKQKITDLEAKLAEKSKWLSLTDKHIKKLKQQLAEKDKTIEEINKEFVQAVKDWKALVKKKDEEIAKITKIVAYRDDMDRSTIINGVKFSNEQIITLQNIDYFVDKHNQDKISFAVEQLEKVKESFKQIIFDDATIDAIIDTQIKQLKGENK